MKTFLPFGTLVFKIPLVSEGSFHENINKEGHPIWLLDVIKHKIFQDT